ncbi:putative dihydrolipoamide acyltransferase [Besnoitia besnoiti]|uniref:Putative dihydrolipoamide acyltransferase n=1 Tax=Besnoitia besnoiti TaxID=94643 RepID=A0A2A9MA29_BESBE|nr:putative dihydrolipoamide acyltransferase [Besnoitia besnoiti]PFH34845.1 putative dihydrolipoamide acyltransferase [Besnoitia besnoiti]
MFSPPCQGPSAPAANAVRAAWARRKSQICSLLADQQVGCGSGAVSRPDSAAAKADEKAFGASSFASSKPASPSFDRVSSSMFFNSSNFSTVSQGYCLQSASKNPSRSLRGLESGRLLHPPCVKKAAGPSSVLFRPSFCLNLYGGFSAATGSARSASNVCAVAGKPGCIVCALGVASCFSCAALRLSHAPSSRFFSSDAAPAAENSQVVKVPSLGDSITEGSLLEWRKNVGDPVALDEVICVIETDKVTVEIHSACAGVIASQAAQEGETVHVGGQLAIIDCSASVADATSRGGGDGANAASTHTGEGGAPPASPGHAASAPAAHATGHAHRTHHHHRRRRTPLIFFKFAHRKSGPSPVLEATHAEAEATIFEDPLLEIWGVPMWRPLSEEEVEAVNLGGAGSEADALGKWTVLLSMEPAKTGKKEGGKKGDAAKAGR